MLQHNLRTFTREAWWYRKVQRVSYPINDVKQGADIDRFNNGLVTDPRRMQRHHVVRVDFFGRQCQLFQVTQHRFQSLVNRSRPPVFQHRLRHRVTKCLSEKLVSTQCQATSG
jgi:hypothetical protein